MAVIEITEQMRVETELRSSEERFRFLADNATDILTLYDQDGLMLYVSPSVQRIAGYSVEESIGRSPFALVHPEDVDALRVRRGVKKGHVPEGGTARWRLRHKDGHWLWMDSRASVIPMEGGGHHILTASRDISDSVRREVEIQAARDRLQQQADELILLAQNLETERARAEQANLAKSQFLAMMSHELRTRDQALGPLCPRPARFAERRAGFLQDRGRAARGRADPVLGRQRADGSQRTLRVDA